MIGTLRGYVISRRPPRMVLEVAGVGYELEAPLSTFAALPAAESEVKLFTHLQVRDDTQQLYGFSSERERELFRALIRTSGVGAKLALIILSGLSVEEFSHAVTTRDVATLKRLPGIGQKTAERLLVDMADRIDGLTIGGAVGGVMGEAEAALAALGYKPREIANLLSKLTAAGRSSEDLVREALKKSLGKAS
ncbi:MAG: Holliday junction branch migration protein RuvA [Gammaproteobacteria bacterium]